MSLPQSTPARFGFVIPAGESVTAEGKVRGVFRQVLKRSPDAAGLEHYRQLLEAGSIDVKTIVRDFLQSDEWKARFIDGHSVEQTVLALYDCALARAPDVDGWNQLTSWEPRSGWNQVIDGMLDGAEYAERFGSDLVPGEGRS